jgi:hypothetical protein
MALGQLSQARCAQHQTTVILNVIRPGLGIHRVQSVNVSTPEHTTFKILIQAQTEPSMVKPTISRLQDAMSNQQTEVPVVLVCLGTQCPVLAEASCHHRPPIQSAPAAKAARAPHCTKGEVTSPQWRAAVVVLTVNQALLIPLSPLVGKGG